MIDLLGKKKQRRIEELELKLSEAYNMQQELQKENEDLHNIITDMNTPSTGSIEFVLTKEDFKKVKQSQQYKQLNAKCVKSQRTVAKLRKDFSMFIYEVNKINGLVKPTKI